MKDELTGAPLPDFDIKLTPLAPTAPLPPNVTLVMSGKATTDENGRYTIDHLPPGQFLIAASNMKYPTITRSIQVIAGKDLTLDFLMPRGNSISGRVLNQDKEPVPDAFVWLIQSTYWNGGVRYDRLGPRVTGEDGSFTFDTGLMAGRSYYLLVDPPSVEAGAPKPATPDHPGPVEIPTYYGDATFLEAATPIVLHPGERREQLDIKLRMAATYCVDGKLEVAGKPASLLFSIDELPLSRSGLSRFSASSLEDGTFHVCGLAPGRYALTSSPSGKLSGTVDFTIANADAQHVHLALDSASLHLELSWDGDPPVLQMPKLPPPPPDQAIVNQTDGEPAPNSFEDGRAKSKLAAGPEITVFLSGLGHDAQAMKYEPAPYSGPFGSDLPAGDYLVNVRLLPGSYVKQMTFDGVAITDGLLHVSPGTSSTLKVVASQGGASVTCKVTDADGNPVPDAFVAIAPAHATTAALLGRLIQATPTDQYGMATSLTLAPGKYRVLAITRPTDPSAAVWDKLLLALFHAQEVELGANSNLHVDLHPFRMD